MVAQNAEQMILRDPALLSVLTGILRHYATVLMTTPPKPAASLAEYRERFALLRGVNLRNNASAVLTPSSLTARKAYLTSAYQTGAFLKDPDARGKGPPNPMTDPAGMDAMMGMMKGNMAMMIPQTLIMGWINAFFSGFVIPAGQMLQQIGAMNPSATVNPFGPGQDPDKMFLAEAENLEVMEYYCIFDRIEDRLLQKISTTDMYR
ncbi:hypothetical protein PRK78_003879 [Emydomyces testavorans]|uniref:ER membrane protein complex subunit 3 n=1 Tax=Emydomyces testavorans TaxID=2070801 RepID=A0AAF0DGU1_9EURO|nr:hypothetical protein PRK78_003879 [Emydomyces testavorans]